MTLSKLNKLFAPYGYKLLKGKGYFYFVPLTGHKEFSDSMVMTTALYFLTEEQWLDELKWKLERI